MLNIKFIVVLFVVVVVSIVVWFVFFVKEFVLDFIVYVVGFDWKVVFFEYFIFIVVEVNKELVIDRE